MRILIHIIRYFSWLQEHEDYRRETLPASKPETPKPKVKITLSLVEMLLIFLWIAVGAVVVYLTRQFASYFFLLILFFSGGPLVYIAGKFKIAAYNANNAAENKSGEQEN